VCAGGLARRGAAEIGNGSGSLPVPLAEFSIFGILLIPVEQDFVKLSGTGRSFHWTTHLFADSFAASPKIRVLFVDVSGLIAPSIKRNQFTGAFGGRFGSCSHRQASRPCPLFPLESRNPLAQHTPPDVTFFVARYVKSVS
jgi:hypothetical protein